MTQDTRHKIIAEARTWIGTPYHPGGRVKKVGADCATLIAEVCVALGIIPNIEIPKENAAHFIATENPLYLETVQQHCDEITEAELQPGDLVMYRNRKLSIFTHAAIVVQWPEAVLHAVQHKGVIMSHGIQGVFRRWERRYFRLK